MIDCSCDRLSSGSFQCVRCLQSTEKQNKSPTSYPNMLFLLIDLRQAYLVGVHNCKQAGLGELQTKENYGNSSFDTLLRFAFYFRHSKHAK